MTSSSYLSKSLRVGAYLAGILAIGVGILIGTEWPKKLGLYRWLASRDPGLVGFTPAHLYGTPWKFTLDDALSKDLPGQQAIVTGANSGIGFAISEFLHELGAANVVMACRNATRCEQAANDIRQKHQSNKKAVGTITTMILDTSSLASVQTFGQEYLASARSSDGKEAVLDMLFLNAGFGYFNKDAKCVPNSVDGVEIVFATNYLGHHLLYRLLEPALVRSDMARVVSTSSCSSFETYTYQVATDLETLNGCSEPFMDRSRTPSYGQSKLAQIVWSKYVTRRNGKTSNIYANAFHPGTVATNIWETALTTNQAPTWHVSIMNWMQRNVMWTSREGALTGIYLATALDDLKNNNIRGKYYHPQSIEVINEMANNETLQEKLWEFSEELVQAYLPNKEQGESLEEEAVQQLSVEDRVAFLEQKYQDAINSLGASEKHIPQATVVKPGVVEVVVPHVMDAETPHYIELIWLRDVQSGNLLSMQAFSADTNASPPTLTVDLGFETTVQPYSYCNLHGLWRGELITVVV